MTWRRLPIAGVVALVAITVGSLEGCFLKLSGAPCQTDSNCPRQQFCDVTNVCKVGSPPANSIQSVSISADHTVIPVGGTALLTAIATRADGTTLDVTSQATWNESDGGGLTLSANDAGELATGVAPGSVDVFATVQRISTSLQIQVSTAVVTQIVVASTLSSIAKGTSTICTATALYTDGSHNDVSSSVAWSSSSPTLTVSNAVGTWGTVTAVDVNTSGATITATYQVPGGSPLAGSTLIKSTSATLTSVAISPAAPVLAAGTATPLTATGTFSDNTTQSLTNQVSWTSDTPTVAQVGAQDGTLQAQSTPGHATVTATTNAASGSKTATALVTVTSATLRSIGVTPASPPPLAEGTQLQFFATGTYTDSSTQNVTSLVTWTTLGSDGGAAPFTVSNAQNSNGLVSASSSGTGSGIVIATSGGVSGSSPVSVSAATLVEVTVLPVSPSIANGTSVQFSATAKFTDNSTQDVTNQATWTDCGSGEINASTGLATAKTVGSCQISASYGACGAACTPTATLIVNPATIASVQVTPGSKSLALGTQQQFVATGIFSDASSQNVTSLVNWTSGPGGIGTVSNAPGSNGLATASGTGSTSITATYPLSVIAGSAALTVSPANLVSIAITPVNPALPVGNTVQLTATGTFSDNSTQDLTQLVTWGATGSGAASVSNATGFKGQLTGLVQGTETIQATNSGKEGTTLATVTAATLVSLQVAPATASIANGTTQQFIATGTYSDTTMQDLTSSVSWSSADSSTVTVSNNTGSKGLASGIGVTGSPVTLTASLSGKSDAGTLSVSSATLQSIVVTPTNASIAKGTTIQMTATGTYSDASQQNLTNQVTWISNNGAASVSNTPGSRGLASGDAIGSGITMTAQLGATSGSTSLDVTAAFLTMIGVSPLSATVPVGLSNQYIATGYFSDLTSQDITSLVTWSVDDGALASVSNAPGSHGLATGAMMTGSPANIIASFPAIDGGQVADAGQLNVTAAALLGIQVSSPDGGTTFSLSQTLSPLQYTATGIFTDHSTLDFTDLASWFSDTPDVASVTSSGGQVSLLMAGGPVTISVTISGDGGSVPLSVVP